MASQPTASYPLVMGTHGRIFVVGLLLCLGPAHAHQGEQPGEDDKQAQRLLLRAKKARIAGKHKKVIQYARKVLHLAPHERGGRAMEIIALSACKLRKPRLARWAASVFFDWHDEQPRIRAACKAAGVSLKTRLPRGHCDKGDTRGYHPPSGIVSCRPMVRGSLGMEHIQRVTHIRLERLAACRKGRGAITVRYVIAPTGRVLLARIRGKPKAGAWDQDCLLKEVRTWRFPQCKGGGIVIVDQRLVSTR